MGSKSRFKKEKRRELRRDKFRKLKEKLKEGRLFQGQKVILLPNGEEKMSEVIMSFVEPYMDLVHTWKEYDKLIGLAVVAWNAALLLENEQNGMVDKIIGNLPALEPVFKARMFAPVVV